MEVNGTTAVFTPSEAKWVQDTCAGPGRMPDLAQKMLAARLALAEQWLEPGEISTVDVRATLRDVMGGLALREESQKIHDITVRHVGGDTVEAEPHVVTVEMNIYERTGLLVVAHHQHKKAQERLQSPELVELEDAEMRDDFAVAAATSDFMDPREAVKIGDALRDPEMIAYHAQKDRRDDEHTAAVAGSIMEGLRAGIKD